jgi:type IV pilus assembly protein PilM
LAKIDEISSTEKLLELIRSNNQPEFDDQDRSPHRRGSYRLKSFFSNPISFMKAISVGVDLGHDDLKMVKMQRISDRKFEMLDYTRVPFDPNISRESPEFHQFLKPILTDFCGRSKHVEIWCTISSARVETRHIRIPKVASKQIPNSVYWTYQREAPFNEKDRVFDFELLGDVEEAGVAKTDVMAYTAPLEDVKTLKDIFTKAGFPLTGISIVPYAFQTLLRTGRIETDEKNVSSLYIGRDWSRIDIFSDGNLMLSRGIKAGVRTMIEALRKGIEGHRLELSLVKSPDEETRRIRAVKRKLSLDFETAQQHFFGLIHESSLAGTGTQAISAREDQIFKMILPALERLVRQVERTLRHYALNYENARVGKIYISSGVRPHQRILDYIGEELGLPTEVINPFASNSNFLTMVPWPESVSEQSSYAPAMGMALSGNSITPNFLYTYKDKQKSTRSQQLNRAVFGVFILLIAACIGVSFWQDMKIKQKEAQKDYLQSQLASFSLRVDQNLILKLLDKSRVKNHAVEGLSQTYLDLAVISEITNLTPPNIRLLGIAADLGPLNIKKAPEKAGEKKAQKQPAPKKIVVLDGIIYGDRMNLESTLAGYLLELKNSALFEQPTINKKSFELYGNREVLRFTAQLNLV